MIRRISLTGINYDRFEGNDEQFHQLRDLREKLLNKTSSNGIVNPPAFLYFWFEYLYQRWYESRGVVVSFFIALIFWVATNLIGVTRLFFALLVVISCLVIVWPFTFFYYLTHYLDLKEAYDETSYSVADMVEDIINRVKP